MTFHDHERGSVTAEFAVAMPAVLLVLLLALGGVQASMLQLRLQDAAADAARSLARGEGSAMASGRLARQVPGAALSSSREGDLVCVRVSASLEGPASRLGLAIVARGCALAGGR